MKALLQSSTQEPIVFGPMVLSSDHISASTGLTPTVTISKNGGSFASPAGAVTEIGNGWYKIAGNATDTNTLGSLVVHATGTSTDVFDERFEVVAYNPQAATNLGLSALPTASPNASNGLTTYGTGTGQINPMAGMVNGVATGTATAGSSSGITLQTALGTDTLVRGSSITIVSGTGAGQTRQIVGYTNSSKIATVDLNWITNPSTDSVYVIHGDQVPRLTSNSYCSSDVVRALGNAVTTTTSGILDVNAKNINNATAPTIPNFPTNFASMLISAGGLVSGDVTNWKGSTAPNMPSNFASLIISAGGYVSPNWGDVANPSTTVNLSGTTVGTVTNAVTLPTMPTDWITAAGLSAGAVSEMQSGLATETNATTNRTTIISAVGSPFQAASDFNATQKTSLNAATPSVSLTLDSFDNQSMSAFYGSYMEATGGIQLNFRFSGVDPLTGFKYYTSFDESWILWLHAGTQRWRISSELSVSGSHYWVGPSNGQVTGSYPETGGSAGAVTIARRSDQADAILDVTNGVETGWTVRQAARIILSALAGELSGAGGTTITIRDVNDTEDRLVATVDTSGNRTAITTNP